MGCGALMGASTGVGCGGVVSFFILYFYILLVFFNVILIFVYIILMYRIEE